MKLWYTKYYQLEISNEMKILNNNQSSIAAEDTSWKTSMNQAEDTRAH